MIQPPSVQRPIGVQIRRGTRLVPPASSELFSAIPRPKIVVSVVGGELHGFARDASAEGKMQRVARVPTVVAHV